MSRARLLPILMLLGLGTLIAVPALRFASKSEILNVEAYTASTRALAQSRSFVGTLRAQQRVELGAGVFGRVSAVHVRAGQKVAAGAVLFEIDTAQLQADANAANADVRSAGAQLQKLAAMREIAVGNLARGQTLAQKGVLGLVEVNALQSRLKEAQADYDSALERREQSRQLQSKTVAGLRQAKVSAPIAGTVLSVEVEPGEFVAAVGGYQQGSLVSLASLDRMEAEILIPEADVSAVAVGQAVQLFRPNPNAAPLRGVIKELLSAPASTEALASARLAREEVLYPAIVALLDAPEGTLLPGMSLRAEVQLAPSQSSVAIPIQALLSDASDAEASVWVLRDGRVQRNNIVLGDTVGSWQAVVSGLSVGEQVITGPNKLLSALHVGARAQVVATALVAPAGHAADANSGVAELPNKTAGVDHVGR